VTSRRLEFCVGYLTTSTSTLGRAHSMWLSLKKRSASIRRTSNPSGSRSSLGQMPTSNAQLSGLPRWECSRRWLFLEFCDPSGAAISRLHRSLFLTRRFRDVLQTEYRRGLSHRATLRSLVSLNHNSRVPHVSRIVKQSAITDAITSARHPDLRNVHEDSPFCNACSRRFNYSGVSNYSRYAFQRCSTNFTL
jgi:hypothetical protein